MNTNTNRTSLRLELSKLQLDKEKLARDRWWKEDQLVHQRLTWLLSAHVILGTGYAWLKYRIA